MKKVVIDMYLNKFEQHLFKQQAYATYYIAYIYIYCTFLCIYIFLQKSQLSILGNLSCKLCSASRGGASLHKYNFLLLYTFALQRIKQVISICLQAFLEVLMWCGQKLFPSPLKYLSFFYNLAPQDLFTYVLLQFFLFSENLRSINT